MSCRIEAIEAGSAAWRAAGDARVFASFERCCYVETAAGMACLGDPGLGRGPLNVLVKAYARYSVGDRLQIDFSAAARWRPELRVAAQRSVPARIRNAWRNCGEAQAFLRWIAGAGGPNDALIGLGAGLTPAGDDFVGGAMIALRAAGELALAERIAAWALSLAETNTNRISRAHLACAAQGEGHEALHALLASSGRSARFEQSLARLAGIGHTSGLDAAAGALLALAARRGDSGLCPGPDLAEQQELN